MKRTNIEIDEQLVEQGKKITGMTTCKDVVNFALKQLIRKESQKDLLQFFGKVEWSDDLSKMRTMR